MPEPRIELRTALQQHDALPVGYVATQILILFSEWGTVLQIYFISKYLNYKFDLRCLYGIHLIFSLPTPRYGTKVPTTYRIYRYIWKNTLFLRLDPDSKCIKIGTESGYLIIRIRTKTHGFPYHLLEELVTFDLRDLLFLGQRAATACRGPGRNMISVTSPATCQWRLFSACLTNPGKSICFFFFFSLIWGPIGVVDPKLFPT